MSKLYAVAEGVANPNSYFLMTNVLVVVLAGIIASVMLLKKQTTVKELLTLYTKKQIAMAFLLTLLGNLIVLFEVMLLKHMDVSIYTIFSSSASITLAALVSLVYFREKIDKETVFSAVLSILAVVVSNVS